jgi:PIN domain nuclease of toxin-antitoxin system
MDRFLIDIAIAVANLLRTLDTTHAPFDRMLIAQAQREDMTLVSADSTFNQYEVSLLWAASSYGA